MNEGLINLVDDDSSRDVQAGGPSEEDRLATSRLQAHVPPPPPSRRPAPPGGVVVPPPRQSYPMGTASPGGMLYPSEPPAAMPRTSWWRSLIAATLAPAANAAAPEDHAERRTVLVGQICVGSAVGMAFVALIVGLRGAPAEASAAVAVAVVAARAVLALGLLAFAYALLSMGARMLAGRGSTKSES